MTDIATNDKISKADQKVLNVAAHEARLATSKAEGAERRAKIKAGKAEAHQALLAGRKAEAIASREARVAGHVERNQNAKKPANDVAQDVEQAA